MRQIAVIIPAYNEERNIKETIISLYKAKKKIRDIYVANDASTDRTLEIVLKLGITNVLTNKENLGKASSLKKLIEEFKLTDRYEWVAFLDADSIVDKNYFNEARRFICQEDQKRKKRPIALLVGQVKSIKYNWLTALRQLEYTWIHSIFKMAQSKLSVITVGPGCASLYRSSALKEVDIDVGVLAEDMDYTVQIHRKKLGRTLYYEKMIVYTHDPINLKDYLKQINRWYTGNWQVVFRHKIPFKFRKIDLELGLMSLEGLFFFVVLAIGLPITILKYPLVILYLFLSDMLIFFGIAVYASLKSRRADIVGWSPLYFLLKYLNAYSYFKSFLKVLFKKDSKDKWRKVSRYSTKQHN